MSSSRTSWDLDDFSESSNQVGDLCFFGFWNILWFLFLKKQGGCGWDDFWKTFFLCVYVCCCWFFGFECFCIFCIASKEMHQCLQLLIKSRALKNSSSFRGHMAYIYIYIRIHTYVYKYRPMYIYIYPHYMHQVKHVQYVFFFEKQR